MPDYSRYHTLQIDCADQVATVTLHRPEALNAVNEQMHTELETLFAEIAYEYAINAIWLTGAGRAFWAGGDCKGIDSRVRAGVRRVPLRGAKRLIQHMLEVEQPIIGAINGDAVGLGATVALLCDIIIASEKARFADTHVRVGIVAGDGGAVIWPLLIGPARAKEFLMRGHFVNGAEPAKLGLRDYAVPPEAVLPKAREIAQE